MVMWQCSFSDDDFKRIKSIKEKHGLTDDAKAVRLALRNQEKREHRKPDAALAEVYRKATATARQMTPGQWQRANASAETQAAAGFANASRPCLVRWSFRLDPEDLKRLDTLKVCFELNYRAEALRFAIFVQAAIDNLGGSNGV